ncbi:non-ribosomal peptide synthetase [Nocardia spumae]|uniref:non-ribosomal peptide synthetase n=1 Tax=Nocardia spumae TaxID=2887190 RepID=UPI001D14ED54|nr:non-ribosomal peptide synthetase [Nocardia spumae]
MLDSAVERNPDGLAVSVSGHEIRYRELDARANRLARLLWTSGAGPESRVAVVLSRSLASVTAIWAVARTGAAFVPIDPTYPRARVEYQLSDSGCRIGLTCREHLSDLPAGVRWLVLDDPRLLAELGEQPASPITYLDRPTPVRPSNVAYVTYTSGSTGRPKGVAVTHSGLPALCDELRATVRITQDARILHNASPSFDAAVLELLLAIGAAATLVIASPPVIGGNDLADLLRRERVTHAFMTPSVLATVRPDGLDTLATIVVGGEACPPDLVRTWATGGRRLHNAYGPTETTIAATLSDALRPAAAVPLGTAIPGLTCHILDARLRPTLTGATGELYVSGPALARGYPGHPEPTAARFVADPFGAPGARMYRTGDLVRRTTTGELAYLGRADHQVKVRGLRIELGEIDSALMRHPEVAQAVTVDRATAAGAVELVSFVRGAPGREPRTAELTASLSAELPAFMLPNTVVVVEQFPLTATGKVDRTALRAQRLPATPSRRAGDLGEDLVAEVFGRILGRGALGGDTDFFAAGGNSLLATQVAARLSEIWQMRVPPTLLFDHPTVGALTTALRTRRFDAVRPPLLPAVRPGRIPLSPNQLRFWLRNQFDTTSAVDNVGFALRLSGVNIDALHAALTDVLSRHEALRTRYPADEDGPYQLVLDAAACADCFAVEDIGSADPAERVHGVLREGFDVTARVPLRVRLLRTTHDHVLVCALHHICADGSSLAPMAQDLAIAYAARWAGKAPDWRPITVQYADYALWQRELLGSRDDPHSLLSRQLRYWSEELDGLPDQLDLPTDRPRRAVASLRGSTVDRTISAAAHGALLGLARDGHASLFMVMRTALAVLLSRLSGSGDIAIGVPMTNRAEPALDGVVGMFVNTTVSRTRIDPREPFAALLARTRARDLANFAHSEVPFEQVVDAVDPVRSPGRHPLYQVGFAFQNFARADLDMPDTALSLFDIETDTVKTDLHIGVVDTRDADGAPGPVLIRFGYSTDLFDHATVEGFIDAYVRLLHSVAAGASTPVGDLILADPGHSDSDAGGHPVEAESLTAALARQAVARPDSTAVSCGPDSISYRDLADRITRLARWLIAQGAGPESIVAVAMRRSIDQVVALYAVAEAGAAWVPIDPDHPRQRIGHILESAVPHCVLTTTADRFTAVAAHAVDMIDLSAFPAGPVRDDEREVALRGDHPAYVIYTSGSTGKPKGVVVTHAAIVNQLAWMHQRYQVGPEDRYLQKTAATFDVSLWGYFLPLRAGARLILAAPGRERDPHAICALIAEHAVTLTDFVPSMLTVVVGCASSDQLRSLRSVFVIGEALPPETARDFAAVCPAQLHNLYGPTEAAVSITEHHIGPDDLRAPTVPIGVPVWNSRCPVLDSRLHEVPPAVTGELFLAGDQLARGYHGAPGLTAARFVADPFGPPGTRMYRSGDLARRRRDGALEYLGRTDFQVKVRGHRIELGEIESALLGDPAVAQAAVTVHHSDAGDRLVGYVVPADGHEVEPTALRRRISGQLPSYMVPAAVQVLAALPVNTSGKLDRAALPDPVFTRELAVAPATELEHTLAEVFADVLGIGRLGATDDFFESGGSSLLVFVLHQRLSARLNRDVAMSAILANPTVAGLAAHLSGSATPAVAYSPAADAVLEPDITAAGCAPASTAPAGTVLLTGATGFLGAHLLNALLTHTGAQVVCLVRGTTEQHPLDRIIASLRRFRLPTDAVTARVRALRGDLSEPNLGLDPADFDFLTATIDAIYHNGARVNHVDPYERLRAANVEGTRSILRLATTRRVKAVHFVSTLGAAVPAGAMPAVIGEDDRLHAGQLQDNGYLISKWVGEELIRQAGERGVPVSVFRPGTICGHTVSAVNNPDDAFWNMVRAAAVLGVAPDVGSATVSLVPVDYVVRALVAISTGRGAGTGAVYHLVNQHPVAVADVLDRLRAHGYPIALRPLEEVRAALDSRSAARSAAGDDTLVRAALLAPTFAGLAGHTVWSDIGTRSALTGTGIECPAIDRVVVDRYIECFVESGLLEPVPATGEAIPSVTAAGCG